MFILRTEVFQEATWKLYQGDNVDRDDIGRWSL